MYFGASRSGRFVVDHDVPNTSCSIFHHLHHGLWQRLGLLVRVSRLAIRLPCRLIHHFRHACNGLGSLFRRERIVDTSIGCKFGAC